MDDIKEIRKDVKEIKELVIKNSVSLDAHMKRTDLNEKRIENMERWTLGLLTTMLVGLILKLFLKG